MTVLVVEINYPDTVKLSQSYHITWLNVIQLMLFIEEGIYSMHNTVPYIHIGMMSTYN